MIAGFLLINHSFPHSLRSRRTEPSRHTLFSKTLYSLPFLMPCQALFRTRDRGLERRSVAHPLSGISVSPGLRLCGVEDGLCHAAGHCVAQGAHGASLVGGELERIWEEH